MSRRNLVLVGLLLGLSACGKKESSSSSKESAAKPAAPELAELKENVPHVEVRGLDIFVDGKAAGSHVPTPGGEARKEEELSAALRNWKEDWKTAHAGTPFAGRCTFEVSRDVTMQLFKSVLYSAAMAGYPHTFFVVGGGTAAPWTGAIEPTPLRPPTLDGAPRPPDNDLAIVVGPASFALSWPRAAAQPADARTVPRADAAAERFPELTAALREMAKADAAHTAKADIGRDRAVIYLANEASLPLLLGVVDAARAVTREVDGKTEPVPVFDVSLAPFAAPLLPKPPPNLGLGVDEEIAGPPKSKLSSTETKIVGKLPEEVVKRVLRANFPRFRACYDEARGRVPTLAGVIATKLTLDATGAVETASIDAAKSTLVDATARACVLGVHRSLSFPEPESGKVSVVHALEFGPP